MTDTLMKTVKKPWGEECWLHLNTHYCFKRITLRAGHKTSLQYHREKLETNYIAEGEALVTLLSSATQEAPTKMGPGSMFTVPPGVVHRVEAVTDVVMFEVSTPQVDDVVRLQDDTSRPDGRIESEHTP